MTVIRWLQTDSGNRKIEMTCVHSCKDPRFEKQRSRPTNENPKNNDTALRDRRLFLVVDGVRAGSAGFK